MSESINHLNDFERPGVADKAELDVNQEGLRWYFRIKNDNYPLDDATFESLLTALVGFRESHGIDKDDLSIRKTNEYNVEVVSCNVTDDVGVEFERLLDRFGLIELGQ